MRTRILIPMKSERLRAFVHLPATLLKTLQGALSLRNTSVSCISSRTGFHSMNQVKMTASLHGTEIQVQVKSHIKDLQ